MDLKFKSGLELMWVWPAPDPSSPTTRIMRHRLCYGLRWRHRPRRLFEKLPDLDSGESARIPSPPRGVLLRKKCGSRATLVIWRWRDSRAHVLEIKRETESCGHLVIFDTEGEHDRCVTHWISFHASDAHQLTLSFPFPFNPLLSVLFTEIT